MLSPCKMGLTSLATTPEMTTPWKFCQNLDKNRKKSDLTENQLFCNFPGVTSPFHYQVNLSNRALSLATLPKIAFFMESLVRSKIKNENNNSLTEICICNGYNNAPCKMGPSNCVFSLATKPKITISMAILATF